MVALTIPGRPCRWTKARRTAPPEVAAIRVLMERALLTEAKAGRDQLLALSVVFVFSAGRRANQLAGPERTWAGVLKGWLGQYLKPILWAAQGTLFVDKSQIVELLVSKRRAARGEESKTEISLRRV